MSSDLQPTPFELLDNLINTTVEKLVEICRDTNPAQILAMLKVADLQSELCRGPFAGLKKQSVNAANAMTRALGMLLPKMVATITPTASLTSPTERADFDAARDSLCELGELLMLRDMAKGADYGLSTSKFLGPQEIELVTHSFDEEAAEHADRNALLDGLHGDRFKVRTALKCRLEKLHRYNHLHGFAGTKAQLDAYVELGRELLEFWRPEYAEADAYVDTTSIGPLSFAQWKTVAENVCAMGFAYAEQENAALLGRGWTTPGHFLMMPLSRISPEQLRTCFAVAGMPNSETLYDKIAECLILDPGTAVADYGADGAMPILIRVGTDVFMPRYARQGNPYAFLVSRISKVYSSQARRILAEREPQFVRDLQALLGNEKYLFGKERVDIYLKKVRQTDIDAVVYEKHSHTLYLIQIKWLAVHAYDLERREEQYDELYKIGKWINKVDGWAKRMPYEVILSEVGLDSVGIDPKKKLKINLVVLNRWWTRFSGKPALPPGAAWLSWSRLCWLVRNKRNYPSPFKAACEEASLVRGTPRMTLRRLRHQFQGLTVWVEQ